jgi:hypothetical protein
MFARTGRGTRRFTPSAHKLLLTSHVLVSVSWLGVALAKLVLAVIAATASTPDRASSLYVAMEVLNIVFPPLVILTFATGVLLTLGTRWSLLEHYWVITKLGLGVAVFTTGAQFSSMLAEQAIATRSAAALTFDSVLAVVAAPSSLLAALFAAHVVMLGIATVLSVYKPWGTTPEPLSASIKGLARIVRKEPVATPC